MIPGVDVRPGPGHPLRHRACPHDRHQAREHARRRAVRLRSRGPDGRVLGDAPPAGSRARACEAHRAGHAGLGAQGVRGTFRAEVFAGESLVHAWAVQVRGVAAEGRGIPIVLVFCFRVYQDALYVARCRE